LFSYVVCNHEDKDASFFVNAGPGKIGPQTSPQQKLNSQRWKYWKFTVINGTRFNPGWYSGWGPAIWETENALGVFPKSNNPNGEAFVIDSFHGYNNGFERIRVYKRLADFFRDNRSAEVLERRAQAAFEELPQTDLDESRCRRVVTVHGAPVILSAAKNLV
jgi:hypothetical protein